jgi:hypothetical protein
MVSGVSHRLGSSALLTKKTTTKKVTEAEGASVEETAKGYADIAAQLNEEVKEVAGDIATRDAAIFTTTNGMAMFKNPAMDRSATEEDVDGIERSSRRLLRLRKEREQITVTLKRLEDKRDAASAAVDAAKAAVVHDATANAAAVNAAAAALVTADVATRAAQDEADRAVNDAHRDDFLGNLNALIENTERIEDRGDIVAIREATSGMSIDSGLNDEDRGVLLWRRFVDIWALREPGLIQNYCDSNFDMKLVIGTKVSYKHTPVSQATSFSLINFSAALGTCPVNQYIFTNLKPS